MDTADEQALVHKLVAMDERAWEVFCQQYAPPLFTFVHLRLGCSRELAEDVVQMTFTRCVRSIGSFDPDRGRLSTWLRTIARHEAHTWLHRQAARSLPRWASPRRRRSRFCRGPGPRFARPWVRSLAIGIPKRRRYPPTNLRDDRGIGAAEIEVEAGKAIDDVRVIMVSK